jgi:hypothetical protein
MEDKGWMTAVAIGSGALRLPARAAGAAVRCPLRKLATQKYVLIRVSGTTLYYKRSEKTLQ